MTFNIQNAGPANRHEFIILKTDLAANALPTLKGKSLNEDAPGLTSPGEGGVLAPGKAESVTVTMTPGKYVFVDNIVEKRPRSLGEEGLCDVHGAIARRSGAQA